MSQDYNQESSDEVVEVDYQQCKNASTIIIADSISALVLAQTYAKYNNFKLIHNNIKQYYNIHYNEEKSELLVMPKSADDLIVLRNKNKKNLQLINLLENYKSAQIIVVGKRLNVINNYTSVFNTKLQEVLADDNEFTASKEICLDLYKQLKCKGFKKLMLDKCSVNSDISSIYM